MHLDSDTYSDPNAFNPERFLDEHGRLNPSLSNTHGQSHVAFGFGKRCVLFKPDDFATYLGGFCRMCIGMHVATQTLFIDIVSLLWAASIVKTEVTSADVDATSGHHQVH